MYKFICTRVFCIRNNYANFPLFRGAIEYTRGVVHRLNPGVFMVLKCIRFNALMQFVCGLNVRIETTRYFFLFGIFEMSTRKMSRLRFIKRTSAAMILILAYARRFFQRFRQTKKIGISHFVNVVYLKFTWRFLKME